MEEERSFDKAKHWLHKAFNSRLIDSLSTNKYQTKQLIEIFASSYPLFSILNDEEYFLQTAKKNHSNNSFSFCENHLLMESMAEAYKAYNIGKYDKAISIYRAAYKLLSRETEQTMFIIHKEQSLLLNI